ncbi:MAG: 50S ribosomal protein L21 [Candidatus Yanofskybacteria bacterium CG10_big_fil_rev_8_21_14_0_10_36_16]|uniref:Large ribosomal subunit protein bL21 n=1 Tax=Candidatus Yanofskybacteria bacterium CG10_big_fil_rev_8_21_14_0_10_36_16 TaxID=1975096 RepID=A0A2J0Q6U2_9BACT|nr:MAG: 50S ribosomal protein L21 [Candidatus Yanofskybacteria bacterium CG10_big_fil_rev_8_21_14_0_10_36_16]
MSFAIIKTGGKQYKVAEGDKILVEKLDGEAGQEFDFEEVLMVSNGKSNEGKNSSADSSSSPQASSLQVGQPLVGGAKVHARILEQGKEKKKIVFKYSSKTRYKKKKGHKQPFTKVEILKISA